jgi:hypothetical protein
MPSSSAVKTPTAASSPAFAFLMQRQRAIRVACVLAAALERGRSQPTGYRRGVTTVLALIIVAASAAVITAVRFATADLTVRRELRRLACSEIARAREGTRIKVVGTIASATQLLVSANRGERCVYYHAWHEELRNIQTTAHRWVAVGEEERGCEFVIEDASGTARVDATSITGALHPGSYKTIETESGAKRGREAIVAIGQRVAVVGVARYELVAGDGDYREPTHRLVISGDQRAPVVVSDDPAIVRTSSE